MLRLLVVGTILCGTVLLGTGSPVALSEDAARSRESTYPNWEQVQVEVQAHFAEIKDYRSGDIISQQEVQPIFARLQRIGWKVSDEAEILGLVLPEDHFLIVQMRDKWGKPRMRRIATKKLIFDRLDRISQADGGQQLIRDMAKLPDAEKAVDRMPDLLPKKSDSRTRKIKSYDKPTGQIYTERDLLTRLQASYSAGSAAAK